MWRAAALLTCALALGACVETQTALDQTTRTLAKRVIDEAVARQFPGVNVQPVSNCIVDQASTGELTRLAGDAVTGVNQQTLELVTEIALRPDAVRCLAQAGVTG